MLVTDIPYSMVNTVAMGPTLLLSLEEKDKQTKNSNWALKHMYYHVHCTFVGM